MMNITLAGTTPHRRGSLTVFPLASDQDAPLPHQLLADALAEDSVNVVEVGQGSVPTLLVENNSPHPVLIMDGEQLLGAKQSRMVNRSVVVEGLSKTQIPVSCMEQGRWREVSEKFSRAKYYSPAKVRRKVREAEMHQLEVGALADAASLSQAQGDVWREIDDVQDAMNEHSPTSSLHDVTESVDDKLLDWSKAFPAVRGQVGVLAFLRGRPLAIDVLGSSVLYAKIHDRLMRGYIMDALSARKLHPDSGHDETNREADDGVAPREAEAFLRAVHRAERKEVSTVGLGSYFVLGGGVVGGALEQELDEVDRMIHLTAFPGPGPSDSRGGNGSEDDFRSPIRRRFRL